MASSTSKIVAVASLLAIVLAGAAFWAWRTDGAGGAPPVTPHPETALGRDDAARAAARNRADAAPVAGDENAARRRAQPDGASLVGEVRFAADDRPAPGVSVELKGAGVSIRIPADASGTFRIDGIAPGGPLTVSAAAPRLAPARVAGLHLDARETRQLGTLWLDEPVRASIRVVGPDGAPVPEAKVEAYRQRTRIERQDWTAQPPEPEETRATGADGRAGFDGLGVGAWSFRAVHPDFASSGAGPRTVLRGGVPLEATIRLERGHELAGTVTGSDGRPLADALVLALPPVEADLLMDPRPVDPLRSQTRTDAEGRYVFRALAAGEHSMAVALPGTLPARVGIVSVPSVTRFDIRLDGGTLAGRVTEEGTGRPIEGARVRAAVWRSHSPTFLTAVTDADGRYSVAAPLGGILQGPARGEQDAVARPVNFDVEKEGFVFAPEAGPTPWRNVWVFGAKATLYDAVMRPAACLAGTVTGPDGPVAGAEVVADVWSPLRGSLPYRAVTGAAGAYRFPGIATGRARLVVTREGFLQAASPGGAWRTGPEPDAAAVVEIPARGEAKLDMRMDRGGTLLGVALDASGAPVPGALVTSDGSDGPALSTSTDAAGRFDLAGARPGRDLRVRVTCDGFADAEVTARVPASDLEEGKRVRVVMDRAGSVRGRVLGADGAPVPGAWVQVAPAKLALDTGYEVVGVWQHAARSPVAADGSFDAPIAWFGGASKEGVVVRAGAPGAAPAISERLAAPQGGAADAGTLRLGKGHRMEGRVVAADGSGPIAGASIEFQNEKLPPAFAQRRDWSTVGRENTPFEVVARTGADGRFVVESLPEWRYELRVGLSGVTGAEVTVAIPQDEPFTIELPRLAPLAGRVEFDDGTPGAQVAVIAHWTNGQPGVAGFTETAADGTFEIPFIYPGSYVLEARRPSDRVIDVLPTTTPPVDAGTHEVRIVVKRGGGRIAGRCATDGGAAVPGAVIFLKPATGGQPIAARSAADGRFEAAGLPDGVWTIQGRADRSVGPPSSFGRRLVTDAVEASVGARDVLLEFRVAATIAGRVVREDGGVPAGSLMVQARRAEGKWPQTAGVGADGAFLLDFTTVGTWTLAVIDRNTGAVLKTAGPAEFQGGATDARLVVASSSGISGRVLDERGHPVAGARVVAHAGTESAETVSDAEGRFAFTSLAAGPWRVEALFHDTGRAEQTGLVPGCPDVSLALRASEVVAVRLVDSEGKPVRGAEVALADDAGVIVAWLTTDSDGRIATRALAPGEYAVTVRSRDGRALATPAPVGRVRSGAAEAVLRV